MKGAYVEWSQPKKGSRWTPTHESWTLQVMVQQEEGLTATVCVSVWAEEMELAFWLLQKLNLTTVSALGYSENRVVQEKEKVEGVEGLEVRNPLTVNYPGHHHLAASPLVIKISTPATYYRLKRI